MQKKRLSLKPISRICKHCIKGILLRIPLGNTYFSKQHNFINVHGHEYKVMNSIKHALSTLDTYVFGDKMNKQEQLVS